MDVPFQLSKSALLQLQETSPKEMGPIPSRSLSYFVFLRPQINGLNSQNTDQIRPEDAGNKLRESLCPLE